MHAWAMTLCVVLSAFVLVDAGVAKQLGGMPRVARNRPSSHQRQSHLHPLQNCVQLCVVAWAFYARGCPVCTSS